MELKCITDIFELFAGQVLIVPLWNWNLSDACFKADEQQVLIVPLWNWNDVIAHKLAKQMSSNRTFMELKLGIGYVAQSLHMF